MYEVTEAAELSKAAELYPGVSKVTVDVATHTAYLFIGRGNRAQVVTGTAFYKLAECLPNAAFAPDTGAAEESPAPADVEEVEAVEPVEAVVTVVKGNQPAARPKGRKEKS